MRTQPAWSGSNGLASSVTLRVHTQVNASSALACHSHVSYLKNIFVRGTLVSLSSQVGNLKPGWGSDLSLNSDLQHLGLNA